MQRICTFLDKKWMERNAYRQITIKFAFAEQTLSHPVSFRKVKTFILGIKFPPVLEIAFHEKP